MTKMYRSTFDKVKEDITKTLGNYGDIKIEESKITDENWPGKGNFLRLGFKIIDNVVGNPNAVNLGLKTNFETFGTVLRCSVFYVTDRQEKNDIADLEETRNISGMTQEQLYKTCNDFLSYMLGKGRDQVQKQHEERNKSKKGLIGKLFR